MKTPRIQTQSAPLITAAPLRRMTRLKTMACAAITLALLAAQSASAFVVQPYYGENKLRFYEDMLPINPATPSLVLDLTPDT